jgi:hypothetical protein
MTSLRKALSLSKEEVRNARPPGTATLVGKMGENLVKASWLT